MEKLILRRADEKDIKIIQQMADKIWKEHYIQIISIEQISYMLEKMYSESSLSEQMNRGHEFFLAFLSDLPAGFMSMQKKKDKIYFLPKFYVDTAIHRKGIGTALFNYVLKETGSPDEIELTVNRKNNKAISFYFKLGFSIDRMEDFDIGNGFLMNDYVMKRRLKV